MSLIQRYADDMANLRLRAVGIAWHEDANYRAMALTELFEDCGTAASVYASPGEVAVLFVNAVSETYAAEFMAQRGNQST